MISSEGDLKVTGEQKVFLFMVGGHGRGSKKRPTKAADREPPPKSLKVIPSQLLLEIPTETNTSMPVWNAIKTQKVSAVWTVNPHSIQVSLTPATSNQGEGTSNPDSIRPCVMVQMCPQTKADEAFMAPVSDVVTLPVIVPGARTTPETSQTQSPDVQNLTTELNFYTRSATDVNICDNFLISVCPDGEECVMHHTKYPFHWQLRSISTGQWIDVPLQAQFGLEKRYCDVNQAKVYITEGEEQYVLDFESMNLIDNFKYNGARRLVNSENPDRNPHFPAEWVMYWWDNYQWVPHKKWTSAALVKKMKLEKKQKYSFKVLSKQYKVNFKTMEQTSVHSGSKRDIRCRPRYRSLKAMIPHLKTLAQEDHSSKPHGANFTVDALKDFTSWYPPGWCLTSEQDYSVVDVPKDTEAYWSILTPFFETISEVSVDIISVHLVQNLYQWDKYQRHKVFMMKKYRDLKPTLEKHLFHGTTKGAIEGICQNNFDPRLAGQQNGAAHGLGSYFAVNASSSDTFASKSATDKVRHVFLAKVLVGMSTLGQNGYRHPPLVKNGSKTHALFDSCVDNRIKPTSYIIFDSCQCYPYSLIKYQYVTTVLEL